LRPGDVLFRGRFIENPRNVMNGRLTTKERKKLARGYVCGLMRHAETASHQSEARRIGVGPVQNERVFSSESARSGQHPPLRVLQALREDGLPARPSQALRSRVREDKLSFAKHSYIRTDQGGKRLTRSAKSATETEPSNRRRSMLLRLPRRGPRPAGSPTRRLAQT
jgi:hypothetical protein